MTGNHQQPSRSGPRARRTSGRAGVLAWAIALSVLILGADRAGAFELNAEKAYIIDHASGSILAAKQINEPFPPASMAKMMTLEVVFDALRAGTLSMDQQFKVSEHAWRTGGAPSRTATMFAAIRSEIRVEDLILGLAVHTANDAAIILAEGIAGSEEAFAELMNQRASAIGMADSHFTNPTGFPDPRMMVTAADLMTLALHLIRTYPEYMHYFGEPEFTWNKIRQLNKNPLVRLNIGVDGFVAGFAESEGYGMVLTSVRDGQRIVAVIHGLQSKQDRVNEAKGILNWAYGAFERLVLFDPETQVGEARVFGGVDTYVGLRGDSPIGILVPRGVQERIKARIVYRGPVPAPVKEGQPVGHVEIYRDDVLAQKAPLYADRDIPVGGLVRRALDAAQEIVLGYW